MINLKWYKFLFGKSAVSPVIGTILMVAVTVIMAAVVGSFVLQTSRPKIPPNVSTSLADDPLRAMNTDNASVNGDPSILAAVTPHNLAPTSENGSGNRVASLYFEGGTNIAIAELSAFVTYMTNDVTDNQTTVILDGIYWDDPMSPTDKFKRIGNLMAIGTGVSKLWLVWADNDKSNDMTPGDRLDFYETGGPLERKGDGVKNGTDFTVKLLHKATQAFIADHTIRVY